MDAVADTCQILQFPAAGLWSRIARKYVDYMTQGDPRAAYYYMEYEIKVLQLSEVPSALQKTIEQEYKKRGFSRPPQFSRGA